MNLFPVCQWMQGRIVAKMPCGIGDVPIDRGKPYAMVQPITGAPDETFLRMNNMNDEIIQVTCVGVTAEQAQWAQGQVRELLQNQAVFTGGVVGCSIDAGGALIREDDVTYKTTDTYRVKVSA